MTMANKDTDTNVTLKKAASRALGGGIAVSFLSIDYRGKWSDCAFLCSLILNWFCIAFYDLSYLFFVDLCCRASNGSLEAEIIHNEPWECHRQRY